MADYRSIALLDLDDAIFTYENKRYRTAVFHFHQFAEKSAKALLVKKYPEHKLLKSHAVEKILESYDEAHTTSEIGDKARYLTGFYFNTRYPGDNFTEITEAQAKKAKQLCEELEKYFVSELEMLIKTSNNVALELDSFPTLEIT
ncbi:MAG: HEPN domain-containing protein [Defluviitaleaceae bacterium]|nr:HEPN domain-containing protein [Defluviitaleaceae bacterium]